MGSLWETIKVALLGGDSASPSKHHSLSKYHDKSAAEIAHTLKQTGGDLARGITVEKQKSFWQGVNMGKKMK